MIGPTRLFQGVDDLLRAVHRRGGVEQRGIVRLVDHQIGPRFSGVGLDGGEYPLLDGLDQLQRAEAESDAF